jgi:hypothetical protein
MIGRPATPSLVREFLDTELRHQMQRIDEQESSTRAHGRSRRASPRPAADQRPGVSTLCAAAAGGTLER